MINVDLEGSRLSSSHNQILEALMRPNRQPHYRAIGEFFVEFSQLEHFVKMVYFLAIDADIDTFEIVTTQPIRTLVKACIVIFNGRFGIENASKMVGLLNKVQVMADERNHIAHAHWIEGNAGLAGKFISSSKLKPDLKYQSPGEVEAETEQVRKLTAEILDTFLDLNGKPRLTQSV